MKLDCLARPRLRGMLLIGIFAFCYCNLSGQDKPVDLLKKEYLKAQDSSDFDSTKQLLVGIVESYKKTMAWDSFELYSKYRIELGERSNDLDYELEARMDLASIYSVIYNDVNTELEMSREIFKKLDVHRLSTRHVSDIYSRMSSVLDRNSKIDSSIYYGRLAVKWADKADDAIYMMLERLGLSEKLLKSQNLLEALEHMLETEKIVNNHYIDAIHKIRLYKNLGHLMMVINDFKKAHEYIDRSLALAEKNEYELFIAENEYLKSLALSYEGKYTEAKIYIDRAYAKYDQSKLESNRVKALLHKAKLLLKLNNLYEYRVLMDKINLREANDIVVWFNEADYYSRTQNAKKLDEFISKIEAKDLSLSHRSQRSLLYLKYRYFGIIANPSQELQAYENYVNFKEKGDKEYQSIKVHRLESEFNREQQDAAIDNLNKLNAAQEKAIAVRNVAVIMGSIMLLILGLLLFGLYKLYLRNQENQKQLSIQNKKITKALEQNQMLVKEIHHRVKNNLQVISSLLSMQVRKVTDVDTKDALNASKSRVQSMSILHQNLYQGEDLKNVNVADYIDQLTQNIKDTYLSDKAISISLDVKPIEIDIDTLVPLGLIANELITNAIKHAFSGRKEGSISVVLDTVSDQLVLQVKDDGVGLENNQIPNREGSLGSRLIYSFVERLDATMELDGTDGTTVKITIPDGKK